MPLLVTSASGANGNGHGALLAFDRDGRPLGVFSEDARIADPRGLAAEPEQRLLFLNSTDRVLALDNNGKVVRDTGVIAGLNLGGGNFGPDGQYYAGLRSARASRLSAIPDILGMPIAYFFAELETPGSELSAEERRFRELRDRPETIDLIRYYYAIQDPDVRNRFLSMVKAIAGTGAG